VKVVGVGEPLRLTTDPVPDFRPMWSPDGRSIAFFRSFSAHQFFVMVIPALGGPEKKYGPFIMPRIPIDAATPIGWAVDSKALYLAASEKEEAPSNIYPTSPF